ncbi:hypothetical protein PBI_GRAVY_49 [Gordonia phage Gravy]|uniref:Uncharacterized protein n=4 Tax=Tanisvirus tanis TaxID=2844677 RepID=A0A7D5FQV3_9CAUD|nr:hypothetical protein HWC73_gp50 [Gordonia phage Tanis]AVO25289.1 hypothetical protein PBI_GRAVY_49 [Gordonia phage Gravy]AVO25382.1 hypothetical protein PBI_KERRY_49 [Gordonia phage Kerry]QKY78721.1 hypothetical protein SEA_GILL_50 [Gordonia phage Gill]QLF83767.1 hypothetical protein SEA_MAGEL_51 [Gordonia phage Magel]QFP95624.1 hypothetical protein SEA_TANIS_50 [Gordonia phage Tanis]
MRDPYRNVKDEVYVPMTYTIGSLVDKKHHSALVFRAKQSFFVKNLSDGVSHIGEAFKDLAESISKASKKMGHSDV